MARENSGITRRIFVNSVIVTIAALAGCSSSDNQGDNADNESKYESWLEDVDNYDGVKDKTGQDEVSVTVGAGDNGLLFAPPAIRVDAGTIVVWIWSGKGGSHNVVAEDGSFESNTVKEEGHEFDYTFDNTSVFNYKCTPHESAGMKGTVIVD